MNIIMASDNNYAKVMAASINSIGKNNSVCKVINVAIIDAGISTENKNRILNISERYTNLNIQYIDFERYGRKLAEIVKKTNPPLPLITFARLYIPDMLSEEKVLYVDCDVICNGSLEEFWNIDLNGKMIAAVQDTVSDQVKQKIGLDVKDKYINAGILLIDLKKWRENDCTRQAIDFMNQNNGSIMHNDQGVINALFKNDIKIVEPKYNVMTPLFLISKNKILKYFKMQDYYTDKEIREAVKKPVLVHFVRFTTSRPWEECCKHPMKKIFLENYKEVFGELPQLSVYHITRGQMILYALLNHFPYFIYETAIKLLSVKKGRKNE